jgi:hypothetical protein
LFERNFHAAQRNLTARRPPRKPKHDRRHIGLIVCDGLSFNIYRQRLKGLSVVFPVN